MTIHDRCVAARKSDFFDFAPIWARKGVVRAVLHGDTPLPPYADKIVKSALTAVSNVNRDMAKRIANDEREAARVPKGYKSARKQKGRKFKKSA